jgi:hypothetical protein
MDIKQNSVYLVASILLVSLAGCKSLTETAQGKQ